LSPVFASILLLSQVLLETENGTSGFRRKMSWKDQWMIKRRS
jgi:hypothetical protein